MEIMTFLVSKASGQALQKKKNMCIYIFKGIEVLVLIRRY